MRNQADTLISVSEKTLKDGGDKVKADDKKAVEDKKSEILFPRLPKLLT